MPLFRIDDIDADYYITPRHALLPLHERFLSVFHYFRYAAISAALFRRFSLMLDARLAFSFDAADYFISRFADFELEILMFHCRDTPLIIMLHTPPLMPFRHFVFALPPRRRPPAPADAISIFFFHDFELMLSFSYADAAIIFARLRR
jgi:hypothetical protein